MKNLLLVTALVALGYFLVAKGCDSTTPPPAPPTPLTPAPTARERAIQVVEKNIASMEFKLRRLQVEIDHYGRKTGATSLRPPNALLNKKANLEYNLDVLRVELQGLRDPGVGYPLPELSRIGRGDFSALPGWRL